MLWFDLSRRMVCLDFPSRSFGFVEPIYIFACCRPKTMLERVKSFTSECAPEYCRHHCTPLGLEVETPAQCIQGSHELQVQVCRTCAFTNLTACTCACSATKEACLDCQILEDHDLLTVGYGLGYEVIKLACRESQKTFKNDTGKHRLATSHTVPRIDIVHDGQFTFLQVNNNDLLTCMTS
ncbi:hypothetical protein B0H13DRAFT_1886023 [Mycena leptocephala]|nr:hypothetical protein B0H13DRAFT_1886023 [Mycena leptocephala]